MAKERWKTLGSGEEREVASIPRRLGARLIDDLVGVGVFLVIVRPLSNSETVVGLIFALLVLLCLFLYEVAMIAIWGQTIGKWAVGIEVVRVEDGSVLGWWRSIGRWGGACASTSGSRRCGRSIGPLHAGAVPLGGLSP